MGFNRRRKQEVVVAIGAVWKVVPLPEIARKRVRILFYGVNNTG